jgi:Protein of unknown function (DUF3102)
MARNAAQQAVIDIDTDGQAIASAGQALTVQSKQAQHLMKTYHITSTDKDVLMMEIRGSQQTAVEAMLYMGARLLMLRTLATQGEWLGWLEQMNFNSRSAQRLMQVTLKFDNREKLLLLGKGKVLELLTLDDEELDELERGELMELDLDDVARMSTTELRKALREAQYGLEAKDKLLARRGKTIDELEEAVSNASAFVPSEGSVAQTQKEQAAYGELEKVHLEANAAIARLLVVAAEIKNETASQALSLAADQAVQHLCQRMADLTAQHGIVVDFEEMVAPAWLSAAVPGKKVKAK